MLNLFLINSILLNAVYVRKMQVPLNVVFKSQPYFAF